MTAGGLAGTAIFGLLPISELGHLDRDTLGQAAPARLDELILNELEVSAPTRQMSTRSHLRALKSGSCFHIPRDR